MRAFTAKFGILIVAAALSACTVQPLYGPGVADVSNATSITVPIANPETREDQLVRNALIDILGQTAPATKLEGQLRTRVLSSAIFRSNIPDRRTGTTNRSVEVTSVLSLTDTGTGQNIETFRAKNRAFYEETDQEFANDRALIDAERRAANEAARSLAAQLQAYLQRNPGLLSLSQDDFTSEGN